MVTGICRVVRVDAIVHHLLDTEIGVDFFSDAWQMHRDALGTAAAEYLEPLEFPDETP